MVDGILTVDSDLVVHGHGPVYLKTHYQSGWSRVYAYDRASALSKAPLKTDLKGKNRKDYSV